MGWSGSSRTRCFGSGAELRREEMDTFARAIAGHLGQMFAG
jgi:hypothetical protein